MMELTKAVKELLLNTATALKGSARRMFMARTVQALGEGGKLLAERELGWNRGTIRKGTHEVEHGIVCIDAFSSRGRKRSDDELPTGETIAIKLNTLGYYLKKVVKSQPQKIFPKPTPSLPR